MGILDRKSVTTQSNETNVNMPVAVEGEGIAAITEGDITILQTDQNAFDNATKLAQDAINFARGTSEDASRLSLEHSRGFAGAVNDVVSDALAFVGDATRAQQKSLGETVTALNVIAREQSKSTDERVAEVSAGAQKTVLYAVLALVAGLVIYATVKK